jgi:hypothetical protein
VHVCKDGQIGRASSLFHGGNVGVDMFTHVQR